MNVLKSNKIRRTKLKRKNCYYKVLLGARRGDSNKSNKTKINRNVLKQKSSANGRCLRKIITKDYNPNL